MDNRFGKPHGVLTSVFFICLTAQVLKAYQYPLPLDAVHQAYVLAQRNDRATADFLAPYISPCTGPEVSCFVTQIKVLTPFAKVVDLSRRKGSANYTDEAKVCASDKNSGSLLFRR